MSAVVVTASSIVYHNFGDTEAFTADITSVDDADTFDAKAVAGFGIVHNAIFTPTTAVVAVPTISGSTITFKVASGSIAGRLTVFGR
jgi:hypothetical protein